MNQVGKYVMCCPSNETQTMQFLSGLLLTQVLEPGWFPGHSNNGT